MSTFTKKASAGVFAGFISSGFVAGPIPGGGDGTNGTDLTYDEERAVRDYVSSASYKLNAEIWATVERTATNDG